MKQLLTLGLIAAVLAIAGAAQAYSSLGGSTGFFQAPTASVVAPGVLEVALDYVAQKQNAKCTGNSVSSLPDYNSNSSGQNWNLLKYTNNGIQKDSYPFRALYGVGGGTEIGFAYDSGAISGKNLWNLNAKYQIPYDLVGIKTAVGASYGASGTIDNICAQGVNDDLKAYQVYAVATDKFNLMIPICVNLGVNYAELQEINKNDGWRAQLGADAVVYKGLSLLADVQSIAKMKDFGGQKKSVECRRALCDHPGTQR